MLTTQEINDQLTGQACFDQLQASEHRPVIKPKFAKMMIKAIPYRNGKRDQDKSSIYLSWSGTVKQIFGELIESAKFCQHTLPLIQGKEFQATINGNEVVCLTLPEIWSGSSDGYVIMKYYISDQEFQGLNQAKSEGRYFCDGITDPECIKTLDISLKGYSERSFVLLGETYPVKEIIKSLGGKFNKRLSCGPAWIFSTRKLDLVKETLFI